MDHHARRLERELFADPENTRLRQSLLQRSQRTATSHEFAIIANSLGQTSLLTSALIRLHAMGIHQVVHLGMLGDPNSEAARSTQLLNQSCASIVHMTATNDGAEKNYHSISGFLMVHGTPQDPLSGTIDFSQFYKPEKANLQSFFNTVKSALFVSHPGWHGILTETLSYIPFKTTPITLQKNSALPRWIVRVPPLLSAKPEHIQFLTGEVTANHGLKLSLNVVKA